MAEIILIPGKRRSGVDGTGSVGGYVPPGGAGNTSQGVTAHNELTGLENSENYSEINQYIHLSPPVVKALTALLADIDNADAFRIKKSVQALGDLSAENAQIAGLVKAARAELSTLTATSATFSETVKAAKAILARAEVDTIESRDFRPGLAGWQIKDGIADLRSVLADLLNVKRGVIDDLIAKTLNVTGKSTLSEVLAEVLTVAGAASFRNGWTAGSYAAGVFGSGAALTVDGDGKTSLEVDDLSVRRQAIFRELVIESMRHVGAEIVISPAWMVCSRVEETGNAYRCYFDRGEEKGGRYESEQMFTVGSQARCQIFRGNRQKYYWRLVTAVGDDWVELSKTDRDGDGVPAASDHIAQLGHRSDKAQQSAIVLSAFGPGAPCLNQYDGINSYSLVDKAVTTLSPHGNRLRGTVIMESGKTAEQAIKDASDEAKRNLDNLVVGNKNYIDHDGKEITQNGEYCLYELTEFLSVGEYTLSIDVESVKYAGKMRVVFYEEPWLIHGVLNFIEPLQNKKGRYSVPVRVYPTGKVKYLLVYPQHDYQKADSEAAGIVKLSKPMLVRGTKAMDFVPAPERILGKIAAEKAALQEKWNRDLNSAKSEVTEAGKLYADQKAKTAEETAKAHADGKVTEEEQKRIAAEQAQEQRLKNYSDAAQAEAEQKSKAYSDGKVTQVEEALNEALNTKTEQAKTEAIAHADGKVDALEKGKLKQLADKQQEDAAALNAAVNALDTKLQRQIDGMTETWQYPGTPLPAESLTDEAGQGGWTDVARLLSTDTDYYRKWKKDGGTAKEIAERHIDDKYTNISDDGDLRFRSWRFQVNHAGTQFRWLLMPEGEISKALAIAGQAQAKAQEALKAAQDNLEKAKQDAKAKAEAARQAAIAAANAKTEEERKKLQAAADKAQSAADKANNAVVAAQAAADKAKEIADNKNATFYTQPSNYAVNDSWVLSAAWNGHKAGSILYAKRSNKTFAANDWEERVRYTDDTLASEAVEKAKKAQSDADKVAEQARNLNTRLTEAQQKLAKAQRELDETKAKALENDGRIDEAEQAILDAKQKAIDEARKAYEKAKQDLLNLDINSRNLFVKSLFKYDGSATSGGYEWQYNFSSKGSTVSIIQAPVKKLNHYVFSCEIFVPEEASGVHVAIRTLAKTSGEYLYPEQLNFNLYASDFRPGKWSRICTRMFFDENYWKYIHNGDANAPDESVFYFQLYNHRFKNEYNSQIKFRNPQLVNGTTLVGYNRAPEDIIAEIEKVKTETKASLKVLDDQIKTKVSQMVFDEYGKAVNTKFTQITQTTDAIKTDVSKVSKNAEQMEQRLNTKIEQTAEGINTEVSKKVGKEEVISRINQSAEGIKIQANKVEINGQAIFKEIKDRIVGLSKYQDTRNDNFPPSYYYQNYKQSEVREFKLCYVIGLNTNKDGQYCALHTMTVWSDKSGGKVKQIAYCDTGSIYYRQGMSVDDIWGDWSLQTNEARLAEEFTDEKVNERINRNTTVIDGGRIKTNTIDANKIIANEALVKRLFAIEAFFRDLYVDFAHVTGMLEAEKVKFGNLAGSPLLEIISANLVRIGQLYINAAGEMEARDSNGVQRLVFNSSEIDTLSALIDDADYNDSYQSPAKTLYSETAKYELGRFGCSKDGVKMKINGGFSITSTGIDVFSFVVCRVWIVNILDSSKEYDLGTIRHVPDKEHKITQHTIDFSLYNMPHGQYYVYAAYHRYGPSSSSSLSILSMNASIEPVNFRMTRSLDRKRTHFGRNGFLSFASANRFIHYSETTGLTVKGEMNIPGVLAAGTVDKYGAVSNVWGAKSSSLPAVKISPGKYRIYHNIGHQQYSVAVTAATYYRHGRDWTTSASYMDKAPNSFVVFLNEDDGDPVDVNFDFQCFGYNL